MRKSWRGRVTAWLALVFLCTAPASAWAGEDAHVATVKNVSGEVTVMRDSVSHPARPGEHLFISDSVSTGSDGSTGIIFNDGALLSVGPASFTTLEDYLFQPKDRKYAFSLFLKKGTAMYTTGRLGKLAPEAVQLKTPQATVGVRGTKMLLAVE